MVLNGLWAVFYKLDNESFRRIALIAAIQGGMLLQMVLVAAASSRDGLTAGRMKKRVVPPSRTGEIRV